MEHFIRKNVHQVGAVYKNAKFCAPSRVPQKNQYAKSAYSIMDISFIIVNYRSRDFLKPCLESVFKHARDFSFEIIIVNNDETFLEKMSPSANVQIIEHNINKGFAEAANLGAKKASGKILFFLNADTEFLTSNVQEILSAFNYDAMVGAAAPKLVLPDGSPQEWGSGYEITAWDIIKNNFGFIKSKSVWLQDKTAEVDWASGAALAVFKKTFFECGGFDEKFFMYFEDVDLCKRIRGIGKKIILLPHIKVLHIGGQSKSSTKEQKRQYYQSQDYYFRKHFGLFSVYFIKISRSIVLFFSKKPARKNA